MYQLKKTENDSSNRIGMVQLSGLNPIAAAYEAGIEIESITESGLIEFEELYSLLHV
jgi:repressor of nif and glnA expression